jgi:hypothetical protein
MTKFQREQKGIICIAKPRYKTGSICRCIGPDTETDFSIQIRISS